MTEDDLIQLKSKLRAAQHEYDVASAAYDELNAQVVSRTHGLPYPDNLPAIKNTATAERAAYEKYRAALREYRKLTALRLSGAGA